MISLIIISYKLDQSQFSFMHFIIPKLGFSISPSFQPTSTPTKIIMTLSPSSTPILGQFVYNIMCMYTKYTEICLRIQYIPSWGEAKGS